MWTKLFLGFVCFLLFFIGGTEGTYQQLRFDVFLECEEDNYCFDLSFIRFNRTGSSNVVGEYNYKCSKEKKYEVHLGQIMKYFRISDPKYNDYGVIINHSCPTNHTGPLFIRVKDVKVFRYVRVGLNANLSNHSSNISQIFYPEDFVYKTKLFYL